MITATILTITLLTPAGAQVEVLRQDFNDRAACRTEKALSHAATLPGKTDWRLVSADCTPARGAK